MIFKPISDKRKIAIEVLKLYLLIPILKIISVFFLPQKYTPKLSRPAVNEYELANTGDTSLDILTLNTGLLTYSIFGKTVLEPASFIQERLKGIIDHLKTSGADIIALQEIYHTDHKEKVISELSQLYPFSIYYQRITKLNIGLPNGELILSKYPIENPEFILFKDNIVTELIAADKGILLVDIKINDKIASLANIHVTAGGFIWHTESEVSNGIRSKQISQTIEILKKRKNNTLILLGDFNAGPNVSQVNYDQIINDGFLDTFSLGCKNGDLYNKVSRTTNFRHYLCSNKIYFQDCF